MNNRKPTWNYILNDIAFSSLLVKCLYSEYSSSQDKYDLEYQIRLMQEKEDKLQQENKQLNSILTELEQWLEKEQDRLVREVSAIYEDSLGRYKLLNEDIYKEIDKIKNKIQELKEKYK